MITFIKQLPPTSPAPTVGNKIRWLPGLMIPSSNAQARPSNIDAAEVLACLSIVIIHLSSLRPNKGNRHQLIIAMDKRSYFD